MKVSHLLLLSFVFISCQKEKAQKPALTKTEILTYDADLAFEIKAQLGEGAFWNHQ